jgi:ADP-ribosylglycohydrolase
MAQPAALTKEASSSRIFVRIYGCEAASNIANSMGDVTEGLSWRQIEERYGLVDKLLPQEKSERRRPQRFGPDWVYRAHHRPPGMGEDGFERHRLCVSAIIRKGGRITIEDLARTWVDDIDPGKFGYLLGPQDQVIYNLLKSGLPPWEVGRYAAWPGFIGTSKMIMPIGMVNACRPDDAARDALDVSRIKDVQGRPDNFALEVAAAIAAATAEALRPAATLQSVIETATVQLPAQPRKEVERALDWARKARDWKDLRPLFEKAYEGKPISNAVEVLSGGLACFMVAKGQPREAIVCAVNLGRDTDCKGYVAGGLAGALRGIDAVPKDWVDTVEKQVVNDPYTVSRRTARQSAEGLYRAAMNEMSRMKRAAEELESMAAVRQ